MPKWDNYIPHLPKRVIKTEEYKSLSDLWIPDQYIACLLDSFAISEILRWRWIEIKWHNVFVPYQNYLPDSYSNLLRESIKIHKRIYRKSNL